MFSLFCPCRTLILIWPLLAFGCAAPLPAAGTLPPPPPGTSRIVVYRDISYYDGPSSDVAIEFNSRRVGFLPRGDVIYSDVPPGTYTVTFTPTRSYPNQFKTVTLGAGELAYVKLQGLSPHCSGEGGGCDIVAFTSDVIDPPIARKEIAPLGLIQG